MKFRKKPIVIEAFQMTAKRRMDTSEWPNWLTQAQQKSESAAGALYLQKSTGAGPDLLCIHTLEGLQLVNTDDWIIQGVRGELYPCRPYIFKATYELV